MSSSESEKQQLIIQDFVSRPDSLRHQLACDVWEQGTSTFFQHKVPFSYSVSPELAQKYVHMIEAFVRDSGKKTVRVLELGCGSGFLSYHICKYLHDTNHPLKKDLIFTVTDVNDRLFSATSTHPLKTEFADYIHFQVADACNLDPLLIQQTDIAFMSYLFDALPAHHLHYENNTLYEWQVQAYIHDNEYYFHNDTFPPTFLHGAPLQDYLIHELQHSSYKSYLRLSHLLHETWEKVPAETTLTPEQYAQVIAFIQATPTANGHSFNMSFDSQHCLETLLTHLPKHALILIYDFGIPEFPETPRSYTQLYGRYAMTQFYSICFPHLNYLATSHSFNSTITSFPSGGSQLMMLDTLSSSTAIKKTFDTYFSIPEDHPNTFFDPIKTFAKTCDDEQMLTHHINTQLKTLDYPLSYGFHIRLARLYNKHEYLESARHWTQQLIDTYGRFAETAFGLHFSILNKQHQHARVLELFDTYKLHDTCLAGIWYEYITALCHEERYEHVIDSFHRFLTETDYFIPCRFFLICSYILEHNGHQDESQSLLAWLETTRQQYPDIDRLDRDQQTS